MSALDDDPLARAIDQAPQDDEPLSAEDYKAIAEGEADYTAARRLTPLHQLERELEEDSP